MFVVRPKKMVIGLKKGVMLVFVFSLLLLLSSSFVTAVTVLPTNHSLNATFAYGTALLVQDAFINGSVTPRTNIVPNGTVRLNISTNLTVINSTLNISLLFNHSNGSSTTVATLNTSEGIYVGANNNSYNMTFNSTALLSDGRYELLVRVANASNDTFDIVFRNLTVDNNAPTIVVNLSNASFQNVTHRLNITASDVSQNLTCDFVIDGVTNSTIGNATNFSVSQYEVKREAGNHNYTVTCRDETNHNSSQPTVVQYYVATANPTLVDLYQPSNGSVEHYVNSTFNVTWLVRDDVDPNPNCSVVINETHRNYSTVTRNNTNTSVRLVLPDNFTFNISVNCSNGGVHPTTNTSLINSSTVAGVANATFSNFTTNGAAPTVTLISPANLSMSDNESMSFVCNATDQRVANFTVFHDIGITGTFLSNATNVTSGRTSGQFQANFSFTNTTGFTITWNCNATDTGGNTAFASTNFTFGHPRQIFFFNVSIPYANNTFINSTFVNGSSYPLHVNVNTSTVNDTRNITFIFIHPNGSVTSVATINASTGGNAGTNNATYNATFNSSILVDSVLYNISANLTNGSGNLTRLSKINVTVDNTAPVVSLNSSNGSFYRHSFNVSWTANDVSQNMTCNLTLDGTLNSSIANATNNTISRYFINIAAPGVHNYTVNCTDETAHTSTAVTEFQAYIADNPPTRVELYAPRNQSREHYVNSTFNVTWLVTDDVDPNPNCSVVINDTVTPGFINYSTVTRNNTNTSVRLVLLDNFTFNISVNCSNGGIDLAAGNDSITNGTNYGVANSSFSNFTTNGAAPTVTLIRPVDGSGVNANFEFMCNSSDQRIANITVYHTLGGTFAANATNDTNQSRASGTFSANFSVAEVPAGTAVTWNCNATDTGGNSAFATANFSAIRPTPSQPSGGGGGGGGSGRSSAVAQAQSVSVPVSGTPQAMILYTQTTKTISLPNGGTAEVSVVKTYNNEKAILSIGGVEYDVAEGQSVNADLNKDGIADIQVTLQDALLSKAHFTVQALAQPATVGVSGEPRADTAEEGILGGSEAFGEAVDATTLVGEQAVEAEGIAEITGYAAVDQEGSKIKPWMFFAGIVALTIVGVVVSALRRKPHNKK